MRDPRGIAWKSGLFLFLELRHPSEVHLGTVSLTEDNGSEFIDLALARDEPFEFLVGPIDHVLEFFGESPPCESMRGWDVKIEQEEVFHACFLVEFILVRILICRALQRKGSPGAWTYMGELKRIIAGIPMSAFLGRIP